jgi:hypothetical protein
VERQEQQQQEWEREEGREKKRRYTDRKDGSGKAIKGFGVKLFQGFV